MKEELDIQLWQPLHDLHRFKTHRHYTQEQFQGILGIVHGFGGPEVGVVGDAAGRCRW